MIQRPRDSATWFLKRSYSFTERLPKTLSTLDSALLEEVGAFRSGILWKNLGHWRCVREGEFTPFTLLFLSTLPELSFLDTFLWHPPFVTCAALLQDQRQRSKVTTSWSLKAQAKLSHKGEAALMHLLQEQEHTKQSSDQRGRLANAEMGKGDT